MIFSLADIIKKHIHYISVSGEVYRLDNILAIIYLFWRLIFYKQEGSVDGAAFPY